MMFRTACQIARPVRQFDGEGTIEVPSADHELIWADPQSGEAQPTLMVSVDADVRVGDLITVPANIFESKE